MLIPLPIVYVIVAILFFLICTITVFMISSKKWKSKYKNEIGSLKQDLDKKKTDLEHAKKQLEKQKDELIIAKNAAPASSVCSKCGAPLTENAKFCKECGEKVAPSGMIVCPSCEKTVVKGKFCPECGHKFPDLPA